MATKEQDKNIGKVESLEISKEMRESYINYAMSVIVSRALPDVRDGLKPVQKRILYSMHEMGLGASSKFRKSAAITGFVLGNYHPHGDAPVYGAMVRMAQDFSLRYPLVKPQGNFGSLDHPQEVAAQRYTEAKLSKMGELMLQDIEKDTVDFTENYDGTKKEPLVLPSPVPQLLLNGSSGIAVGMATKVPPHNLGEICDATVHLIDNPKSSVEDMFKFIQGPDFPTGGVIYDKKEIMSAYSQGGGPILIRGKADIVEAKRNFQIIITEIPFGIQKLALLQQIAKLVQEDKIKKIRDIRDESGQEGVRVVIELKEGAFPKKILNFLYKKTSLQTKFHLNMVVLVDGLQPKVLNLVEILQEFVKHRKSVIIRKTKFEKKKAEQRAHILEGFVKALKNIDAVIKTIKSSNDRDDARKNLIKKFKLSEIQANAILDMRLSALAKLEQQKVANELKEIKKLIQELDSILKSPAKVKNIIKKQLKDIKETFGDSRRTKVFVKKVDAISEEDLVPQEPAVVILTQKGFVKRLKPSAYKVQKRGGKGVIGVTTKEEDVVEHLNFVNTHDDLLFFTDSGKVFKTKVFEIPESSRVAKGKSLLNFLELSSDERVLAVLPLSKKDKETYFVMSTKKGLIKKSKISDFENLRKGGLIAIKLKPGDLLTRVHKSFKNDHIVLVTKKGKSIRFKEQDARSMGRVAAGVKGISLSKDDEVVGMEIIGSDKEAKPELLVISENGYGKRTDLSNYRAQKRGGSGIKTMEITSKTGDLIKTRVLTGNLEELIVISKKAKVIRTGIANVSKMGRATQGVRIIRLDKGDKVASITCF